MPYLLTDEEHRGLAQLAASMQAQAANLSLFLSRDCQRLAEPPAAAPAPKPGEPAPAPPSAAAPVEVS